MSQNGQPLRIATLSVHACPLAPLGAWETGGMNVYIREVSRHLSDLGVEVDVFTRQQGDDHVDEIVPIAEHVRVIHVPAGPGRYLSKDRVVEHLPEFICNMRDFVLRDNPRYDVIHSHYWLSGRVASYFKSVWQVPMLAMFHTLAELKNQVSLNEDEQETDLRVGIERMTVQAADRVIASTHIDRSHLETYYAAERGRVTILPCGVDHDLFKPGDREAARRTLDLGDERLILFVGRIQQLKGIEVLLRATRILADRQARGEAPPFRVIVVGGRPTGERNDPEVRELHRLQRLAAELQIDAHIHWAGAIEQTELPVYYRAADTTVVPSTYESFGLVALESMACGTPVVAAGVGGLLATVQDSQTGFLMAGREPADYADRVGLLLKDRELRQKFSAHAIERAAQFGWRRVAAQLLEVYQDLTFARRHGEPPATVWQK